MKRILCVSSLTIKQIREQVIDLICSKASDDGYPYTISNSALYVAAEESYMCKKYSFSSINEEIRYCIEHPECVYEDETIAESAADNISYDIIGLEYMYRIAKKYSDPSTVSEIKSLLDQDSQCGI